MNPATEHEIDAKARQWHDASLAQLTPRTLMQLRAARQQALAAPQRRRQWPWLAATACSTMLAVLIGVQWLSAPQSPAPAPVSATAVPADETIGPLDENPDLYLWLASSEAQPLAME